MATIATASRFQFCPFFIQVLQKLPEPIWPREGRLPFTARWHCRSFSYNLRFCRHLRLSSLIALQWISSPSTSVTQVEDVLQIADGKSGHAATVVVSLSGSAGQIVGRPVRPIEIELVNLRARLVIDMELIVPCSWESNSSA